MNGNFRSNSLTYSVLIIGGGASGLSVAHALLQHGHLVTVLEQNQIGSESSWAGGGILAPLLPWDYSTALNALALHSMARYEDWVASMEADTGLSAEYWRCGLLALEVGASEQACAWCAVHGMTAQLRTLDTLWLPEVAQVRNPRLVSALRAAVTKLGGTIHENCTVEGLDVAGRVATTLQTAAGTLTADMIVIATGAWSGLNLTNLPAVPHIRPIRGQMLLFKLEPGVLDTILYRQGLYLIPRRDGHILVGSTLEDAGFDKSTDAATLQRLHREAAALLPVLAGVQPIRHWAGLRPGSPDNIPIIDRHPDFDNVFINVGHYRYGVTLAPASAELLVDLMEGRTPVLDPAPYRWAAALQRRWGDTL
jgi:glycine oxidase